MIAYGKTDEGKPFSHIDHPHLGNPGGPCDALTDHRVRTIVEQFGSRMGKTFFAQTAQQYFSDISPGPGMIASESEKLALEITGRWYAMAEKSVRLKGKLKPPRFRKQSRIDLPASKIYVAWARSVSTLADKPVRYGHANEVDKWEHVGATNNTAKEADPLKLFMDRGKQFPRRKFIIESTPTVKGKSRIERMLERSTNCRFYVPCPHCKHYQTLRLGNGKTRGGILWDKTEAGRHDTDLAQRTARYECENCDEPILDHHRAWMMRRGVWCPEGCSVIGDKALALFNAKGRATHEWRGWEHAPWIKGRPTRNGTDAGYQISSLYSLKLNWGDIAAERVRSDKPQDFRNFVNQWLAETWEAIIRSTTWEKLGARIIVREQPRGIAPRWASLLTIGIDRQTGDRFPWVTDVWGPGGLNATIAYGESLSFDDLFRDVVSRRWAHSDGGSLRLAMGLMDFGFLPKGVHQFCQRCQKAGFNLWPSKGSSTAMESDFRVYTLGAGTSMPGMRYIMVDTIRSQMWIEDQLTKDDPDEQRYSLFAGSLEEHQDFLQQLLNDAASDELDGSNNVRQSWDRVSESIPNDWRDGRRYAYVGMTAITGGKPINPRDYMPPAPQAPKKSRFREIRIRR